MKKKLPSIDRRPSGLKSVVEKAILKRCENATADEIANAIENETSHPALDANAKFPPAWVWWCVAQREMTQDAESELDDGSFSNVANALVARYVYGSFRDEVFDRKAKDWISIRALDNLEAVNMPLDDKGKPVPAFEILKTDRRTARVHNERYKPGQSKEVFFEDGVHWLNTWEKPDLKPVQGNAKPMLDHPVSLQWEQGARRPSCGLVGIPSSEPRKEDQSRRSSHLTRPRHWQRYCLRSHGTCSGAEEHNADPRHGLRRWSF